MRQNLRHLDSYQLADMLTVAISSEDETWANEVRQAMRERPEAERRAYARHATPG
jgi:hypothetical protein